MIKGTLMIILTLILALAGCWFLWVLFFGNKGDRDTGRDGKIEKVQSLIHQMEKENPELVRKIRSQMVIDAKLKSAKDTEPEDIGRVVKHWLETKDDGEK